MYIDQREVGAMFDIQQAKIIIVSQDQIWKCCQVKVRNKLNLVRTTFASNISYSGSYLAECFCFGGRAVD